MINKILKPLVPYLPENNRLERIWIFAKVDFRKRYYDSWLGLLWALINPLFQVTIYYFVFTLLFGNEIENFALYIFLALICWMFFSESSKKGIYLLASKRYLLESMPFQRKDLFLSSSFSVLFGFLFNFIAYLLMSAILGVKFSYLFFWFPILMLNIFLITYSTSLILGTVSIFLKDITHLWDIIVLVGFWTVPIFWNQKILFEGKVSYLLLVNPITGIIVNARNVLLFNLPPITFWLVYDFIFSILLMILSYWIFNQYSHKAAEKL